MRRLLFLLALVPCCFAGFSYQRQITVPAGRVSSNLTDFTLIVHVALDKTHVTNASAYDVGFYTSSACDAPAKMQWRTLSYDAASGSYWAYVRTNIPAAAATVFYACYGDSSITTKQYTDHAAFDTSTVLYVPADDAGSATSVVDVVSGTAGSKDGPGHPASAPGKIGGALSFGDEAFYDHVTFMGLNHGTSITVSAWFKTTDQTGLLIGHGEYDPRTGFFLNTSSSTYLGWSGASYQSVKCAGNAITDNSWHHAAVTQSGTTATMYIDGTPCAMSGSVDTVGDMGNITLGAAPYQNSFFNRFGGLLDEVTISSTVRTGAWIAAQYANQNDPDTFVTVGSETATGGPQNPAPSGLNNARVGVF